MLSSEESEMVEQAYFYLDCHSIHLSTELPLSLEGEFYYTPGQRHFRLELVEGKRVMQVHTGHEHKHIATIPITD